MKRVWFIFFAVILILLVVFFFGEDIKTGLGLSPDFSVSVKIKGEEPPGNGNGGGGGGGGGRADLPKGKLSVDRGLISASLKQGESGREQFAVENSGEVDLNIVLESTLGFLSFIEGVFVLRIGKSKIVFVDFAIPEDTEPGIYMGRIFVKGEGVGEEILVSVEVESRKPLFDVMVSIRDESLEVMPGEELVADVTLVNIDRIGVVNVSVDYAIENFEGNVIVEETELVAVETEKDFVKVFVIPENTEPGDYVLYVKATYEGRVGSASAAFGIVKRGFNLPWLILLIILLIVLILLLSRKKKKPLKLQRGISRKKK